MTENKSRFDVARGVMNTVLYGTWRPQFKHTSSAVARHPSANRVTGKLTSDAVVNSVSSCLPERRLRLGCSVPVVVLQIEHSGADSPRLYLY